MQLLFTPEQRRFRVRLRELLAGSPVREALAAFEADPAAEPDPRPLLRAIGQTGMLAVDWPARFGGQDLSIVEAAIVCEELIAAGVPDTMFVNSVQIVGLFVLLAGTGQQQERLLPALAAGTRFASVLYTEPETGSDLGALTTRATPDGDGFRLDGVKKYNLKSHLADVALVAARIPVQTATAEANRYEGITLFLVDLSQPGVTIRPITSLATERFNQVELAGVPVRAEDVIGEVGHGWPLLLQGLAIERTGMDYSAKARRWFTAARAVENGSDDDLADVARLGAQVDAARLLAWRVIGALAEGRIDETAAAMAKWYSGEVAGRVPDWLVHRAALPDPQTPLGRLLDGAYRDAPGQRLSAGTSEVMLEVVASRLAEVVG